MQTQAHAEPCTANKLTHKPSTGQAYEAPRLTLYGRVADLTAGGSSGSIESDASGVECTGNSPFQQHC